MTPTLDPKALGWDDGRPCGQCGAFVFDVAREIVSTEGEAGQVTRTPVVTCQCPRYYEHVRKWRPRGLEILGTFDTRAGELEMFPVPILASEMDPDEDPSPIRDDLVNACPGPWHPFDGPMAAWVMVQPDWDGDDSKAITYRLAWDVASDTPAVIDRPPPLGTSARPPLVGLAVWAKLALVPVECSKGIPRDALGWGFEGDDRWRSLAEAKSAGVAVASPPKARTKPANPPMMEFSA